MMFSIRTTFTMMLVSVNSVTAGGKSPPQETPRTSTKACPAIDPYPLRCNNKDLGIQIWADCVKHLRKTDNLCEVVSSTERKQYCRHVYGLSLDNRQHEVPCDEVVLVLADLWAACHIRGGENLGLGWN
jgi:hypothetical protein